MSKAMIVESRLTSRIVDYHHPVDEFWLGLPLVDLRLPRSVLEGAVGKIQGNGLHVEEILVLVPTRGGRRHWVLADGTRMPDGSWKTLGKPYVSHTGSSGREIVAIHHRNAIVKPVLGYFVPSLRKELPETIRASDMTEPSRPLPPLGGQLF